MDHYTLDIEESIGCVPAVGVNPKTNQTFLIGFKWVYFITNKANKKTVLTFEAEDDYLVTDFNYRGYCGLAILSHKKLSEEFLKRIADSGLRDPLAPLDQSLIDHLYHDTVELLKMKGAL